MTETRVKQLTLGMDERELFDAGTLAGAPVEGAQATAFVIRLAFPDRESWNRGIILLSQGKRRAPPTERHREVTLNGLLILPDEVMPEIDSAVDDEDEATPPPTELDGDKV